MTQLEFLPFFSLRDMVKFLQVSKECNQLIDPNSLKNCINYQVLFKAWGIKLTPAEVAETKILSTRALQVLAKHMMIKSIVKSQRIIPTKAVNSVTGTSSIPDMTTLTDQSLSQLRNMTITQLQWMDGHLLTFGLTLNDGQTCKAGPSDFNKSHKFDPANKITKIKTIIRWN